VVLLQQQLLWHGVDSKLKGRQCVDTGCGGDDDRA